MARLYRLQAEGCFYYVDGKLIAHYSIPQRVYKSRMQGWSQQLSDVSSKLLNAKKIDLTPYAMDITQMILPDILRTLETHWLIRLEIKKGISGCLTEKVSLNVANV